MKGRTVIHGIYAGCLLSLLTATLCLSPVLNNFIGNMLSPSCGGDLATHLTTHLIFGPKFGDISEFPNLVIFPSRRDFPNFPKNLGTIFSEFWVQAQYASVLQSLEPPQTEEEWRYEPVTICTLYVQKLD
jgi:hypothetical protein